MRKYILWDNDGVLVDTEHWYFVATQQSLAEVGIELTLAAYLEIMIRGQSSWDLALAQGIAPDVVNRHQARRDLAYEQYLTAEDIEIPGVLATLSELADDYRMAIVTTSKKAPFDLVHQSRQILPLMEFVLTREDYVESKPDPEPYLLALERFGALPQEAVVIEDSQRGLEAALAAGIDCVVVYNNFTATHDFSGASHRVRSLRELPAVLRGFQ